MFSIIGTSELVWRFYVRLRSGRHSGGDSLDYFSRARRSMNTTLGAKAPIFFLANLDLGRACVITGGASKARAAYQDFLALWQDAGPNIPILKEAKAEHVKLQ
jgi:hypothetical protein